MNTLKMGSLYERFEAEYCPPLDPALLSAILSDYNLDDEAHVRQIRLTLDPLKESAAWEEDVGFDASGTGGRDRDVLDEVKTESYPETSKAPSRDTDLTSMSNELFSLSLEADSDNVKDNEANFKEVESLDEDAKVQLLNEVFRDKVSTFSARYTLRKCNGNWHNAVEQLLNHVYFDDSRHSEDASNKISAKSIDAFSEEHIVKRGRKGKAKNRSIQNLDQRWSSSLPVSPVDPGLSQTNKWQTSSQDIEFIASRTSLPRENVTSIYHKTGGSLSRTIAAVVKANIQTEVQSNDPILAVNAHDLSQEFPSIAPEYAAGIVRLTHPSTAAAHELAKVLTSETTNSAGGLQIIANYRRPEVEGLLLEQPSGVARAPSTNSTIAQSATSQFEAAESAPTYAARRNAALAQAYAAHRKAKSDRLMGGAAAYYGQLGREYGALSFRAAAAAADELADSQSTKAELDLHGIDVLNAVRIAQEKVEKWWVDLGENRVNGRIGVGEREAGYRIIVGLGRHSEGGKGKLGPSVTKMLKNDGWKFELQGPAIFVKGRIRT